MTAQPSRVYAPEPREPVLHDLPSLRIADQSVTIQLRVRRSDDGAWLGRLRFLTSGSADRETADIFRGRYEEELWQSVRGLGEHHLRALYHSLA
ncbi:MAG: hypothetical protein ACREMG_12685 [Gemmatimonadales bacterium]